MKKFITLFSAALLGITTTGVAQTIMLQDFESATVPALPGGWTQNTKAATGWKTNTGIIKSNGGKWTQPAHTKYAVIDDWNNNEDNDSSSLISPVFSLVGHANAVVAMDYYFVGATYGGNPTEKAYLRITTNGTSWTNIDTLDGDFKDWQYTFKSLAAYSGQATVQLAIFYTDNKGGSTKPLPGIAIDYIRVYDPVATDIRLVEMTPVAGTGGTYGAASGNITLGGKFINYGTAPVSTFAVGFQQGATTPVLATVTSASVPKSSTGTFAVGTPLTLPSALGDYPVKMWVSLASDLDVTNDTDQTVVTVVSFKPTKKLLIEEGTGTWCGWCPRGTVYMDSFNKVNPGKATLIAMHNNSSTGDPMAVPSYDAFISPLIGGYPNVLVDRKDVMDPSELFDMYAAQKDNFGYADITMTDMGAASFGLSVKVSVKPAVDMNGDYRLVLILTESDVHSELQSYEQHNYYANGQAGPLVGAGRDWAAESDWVKDVHYEFVARAIVPSPTGAAGSLPATMTAGTTYDYTFNTTVPQPFHRANMHVAVALLRNSDGLALNSAEMVMPIGISNVDAGVQHLSVYPNPARDITNINFSLNETAKVSVQVLNPLGQVVSTVNEQQYEKGAQKISVNTANLAAGIYTIKLSTEKGSLTEQLSVVK